jgi:hypothetical protein
MDSILEEGYRIGGSKRRQAIDRICLLTCWPRQACWDRARKLGLTQRRNTVPKRWTQAEERRLSDIVGYKNAHLIAQELNRSVLAVRTKLKRMDKSSIRVREGHTKSELAQFLGRSPKTTQRWIDLGWLKGTYEGKWREDDTFRISDAEFRSFWRAHPTEIPFHTLSRDGLEWFLSLMVDIPKVRIFSRPRTRREATNGGKKQLASSLDY